MSQGTVQRVDVVIVTAIPLEYEAVLKVDAGAVPGSVWREDKQANGVAMAYRAFEVPKGRPLQVAVAVAPDMATAAALATLIPLIEKLEPRCIAMCGVCAGRPGKVQLGDVIAAERLYYHDTGKQTHEDGKPEKLQQDLRTFNLRPDWKSRLELWAEGDRVAEHFKGQDWLRDRPLSSEWRERRALLALGAGTAAPWNAVDPRLNEAEWPKLIATLRDRKWIAKNALSLTKTGRTEAERLRLEYPGAMDLSPHGSLHPFRLHVAPMASGNKVIEDEKIWDRLATYERKTLGLEMEAAAVGAVAHYLHHKKLDAVAMKGVMDFANAGRDDHFKEFAARASAECLLGFLRHHLETGEPTGYEKILNPGVFPLPAGEVLPSKLLQARYGLVPWHDAGRSELLQELDRWLEGPPAASAWLVHAEGGIGKTRLAIEWVRQRRQRFEVAGFLELDLPATWLDQLTGFGWPVVIVIDYAEIRGDLVSRLRKVAQLGGSEHRVRVLLLARNDGDWWQSLLTQAPELESLLIHKSPRQLAPLASKAPDRQKVLEEAVLAFTKHWELPSTPTPKVDLSDPIYSRALYLHMAALLAVEDARKPSTIGGGPAKLDSTAVLRAVLDHEERAWLDGSARPADWDKLRKLARQIVVATTLRGGLHDEEEARRLVARLQRREPTDHEEQVLVALRRLYQHQAPNAPYLPGLEPDVLGEGMVLRLVQDRATIKEDDWLERAVAVDDADPSITTAFTVLGRASVTDTVGVRPWIARLLRKDLIQRAALALRAAKVVGAKTVHAVVGDVLAEALEHDGSLAIARALGDEGIPRPSVSLMRVAEWQSRTMLEGTAAAGPDDALALVGRARLLLQHGADLRALGQRAAALATTQEAVARYRALAERSPEAFLPVLAGSLNNLGTMLSDLGQRAAALATTQEAVDLYRAAAERRPEAFLPDLANSVNNLGNRQSELGRREAALATTQEAVALRRALAERSPDAFLPDLASSLNNLGAMQHELGLPEAALATTQEAVGHYRALAERSPEAFLPNLAGSLNNLGNRQSELRQREAALATTQEAVALRRALAERSPEAFLPDLAMSLNNLGNRQSALGQREEALATTQEAAALYRALAERSPEAFLPVLAMSLNNLGAMQLELGQLVAALATTQEAVALRRALAKRSPEAFLPALASSLTNQGIRQSKLGQPEAALATTQEAVGHYRALAERRPEAFLPTLAGSLKNLGIMQSELGRREEALATTQEAVDLYRALAQRSPEAFLPALASSLNNLGIALRQLERDMESADATREAESISARISELRRE